MRTATLVLAFLAAPALAAPTPEPTEAELKAQLVKMNKDVTTLEGADAKLKELLKNKPLAAKLVKQAGKMQAEGKDGEKPFRFYSGLVIAKLAQVTKNHDEAGTFFSFCTDVAIDDLQSADLIITAAENQIEYLWERKKFDKVVDVCDRILNVDGGQKLRSAQFLFLEQQIKATAKTGDTDKALSKANDLAKATGNGWYFTSLRGWVLREAGKLDESVAAYRKAIDKLEDDENIPEESKTKYVRNLKYILSGVYLDDNKLDRSTELLQELIKSDPDNATFYNDLGFLWADHDQKIDESEKLVRKAIELDLAAKAKLLKEGKIAEDVAKKTNPAYADSLGWVLFKQKKYDEAMKYLKESAADDDEGNHIEIWDHVGDCYLAMGKKKEALETFQKALKMEDVSKKDAARRKKVTEKVKALKAELK